MADSKVVLDTKGLQQLIRTEPQKVERWLKGFAEAMVTDIKLSMNTSPAGQSYTRGGITHVASQPNYPPNVDIGTLRASIRQEKVSELTYHISDGVEYGLYLEDGTENMAPRPFMQPAFDRASKTVGEDAARNLGLEDV